MFHENYPSTLPFVTSPGPRRVNDPDARTVEVFSLKDGVYGPAAFFEAGDAIAATPVLPGLELRLDSLWE